MNDKKEPKEKQNSSEVLKTVDMYPVKSRWTTVLFLAFLIAFLIFALAIFVYPQVV